MLAHLHLSQADLASRSGISTKHINQIIQGQSPITYETALVLERVAGTPASIWNRLEATTGKRSYATVKSNLPPTTTPGSTTSLRKPSAMPVTCPPRPAGASSIKPRLRSLGIADIGAWNRVWRKPFASSNGPAPSPATLATVATWLRIGEIEARELAAEPFSKDKFRAALRQIRALTRKRDFLSDLQYLCAAAGVVVIYVPEVDRCRISGAAWWATPNRAVIQLSDRYKSDDQFWFSFFHEAAHVLLHSKKQTSHIDDGSEDDTAEEEANQFAAYTLVSQRDQVRLATLTTIADVKSFAADIGVSEGVVVGRLHHLKAPGTGGKRDSLRDTTSNLGRYQPIKNNPDCGSIAPPVMLNQIPYA